MTRVAFGLIVPGDALEKSRRQHSIEDVNRLLNTAKGADALASLTNHLQFLDSNVLEGWTALSYIQESLDGKAVDRVGHVSDEQYQAR